MSECLASLAALRELHRVNVEAGRKYPRVDAEGRHFITSGQKAPKAPVYRPAAKAPVVSSNPVLVGAGAAAPDDVGYTGRLIEKERLAIVGRLYAMQHGVV